MDKIKNFFDDFTFHARVMPIMVVSLPIALMAISKGVLQGDWPKNAGLILLSLVFFTMTSKIARNLGKSYEKKMYQQLGGMPSTIALRFSDDTFDEITKKRYHKKLNLFEGIALPLNVSDETTDTDQQYISASNILRNYANSNRDKEQRVYQELKEYNFWRNLYGTKSIEERALALTKIVALVKWDSNNVIHTEHFEFGCSYQQEDGNVGYPWKNNGTWVLIPWKIQGLYK